MKNDVKACVYESYIVSIMCYIRELRRENKAIDDEEIKEYIDYTLQDLNALKRNTLSKRSKYILFNAILNRTYNAIRNSSKIFVEILFKITEKTKETRLIL